MENKVMAGCIVGVLQLFVIQPMWFTMLYHVLSATEAESWLWGIYWAYVPVCVIVGLASAFIVAIDD